MVSVGEPGGIGFLEKTTGALPEGTYLGGGVNGAFGTPVEMGERGGIAATGGDTLSAGLGTETASLLLGVISAPGLARSGVTVETTLGKSVGSAACGLSSTFSTAFAVASGETVCGTSFRF
jgi:hypothetical protein